MPPLLRFPIPTPAGLYFPRPAAAARGRPRRAQDASEDQTVAHERRSAHARVARRTGVAGLGYPGGRKQVAGSAAPAAARRRLASLARPRPHRRRCAEKIAATARVPGPAPRPPSRGDGSVEPAPPRSLKALSCFQQERRKKNPAEALFLSSFFFFFRATFPKWRKLEAISRKFSHSRRRRAGEVASGESTHANSRPPAPPRLGCACVCGCVCAVPRDLITSPGP